jgi:hypothetical protein
LAFALHILQNKHEYGHMNNIMNLLKPSSSPNMLIPYEQHYIQALYRQGNSSPNNTQEKQTRYFRRSLSPNLRIPHE